jgi:uncharacterized protein YkwD
MPMTRTPLLFLSALAAAVAASCGPASARADARPALSHSERSVIRLVNRARAQNGLAAVRASRALNRAADRHTSDMLQLNFFDHTSMDGTPFDARVRRYLDANMVGETLAALGSRHGGAATVVRMWMESPPHRAVLLNGGFRRIGVARRWGMLGGTGRAVVTADFASRH